MRERQTKLGDVSNSRAVQNWKSSVEGLGCVKLVALTGREKWRDELDAT